MTKLKTSKLKNPTKAASQGFGTMEAEERVGGEGTGNTRGGRGSI